MVAVVSLLKARLKLRSRREGTKGIGGWWFV